MRAMTSRPAAQQQPQPQALARARARALIQARCRRSAPRGAAPLDTRRTLSRSAAQRVYDRAGQTVDDSGSSYGRNAVAALRAALAHAVADERVRHVLEVGSGSGKLAAQLLGDELAPACQRYTCVDLSSVQASNARTRLRGDTRAVVVETDGSQAAAFAAAQEGGPLDLVVSTYMLDLLSDSDVRAFFAEARTSLRPGGVLALAGLSPPPEEAGVARRIAAAVWALIHSLTPHVVGGCRAQALAPYAEGAGFEVLERAVVCGEGEDFLGLLCSEVLVARRPPAGE